MSYKPESKYALKDNANGKYYTADNGTESVTLKPLHDIHQTYDDANGWVNILQVDSNLRIVWKNIFLDENLRFSTDPVDLVVQSDESGSLTLSNKETGNVSDKKFIPEEVPESHVLAFNEGFKETDEFPDTYKLSIEDNGISLLGDILFVGMQVPVKIYKRGGVYAIKFANKYLNLEFQNTKTHEQIDNLVSTINYNPDGNDIIQYTLADEVKDDGMYNSGLFYIRTVDEERSLYRIENFQFPDTFLNISDDEVFYPSILETDSSLILFEPENPVPEEEEKEPEDIDTRTDEEKIYDDLGINPTEIPYEEETAVIDILDDEPVILDSTTSLSILKKNIYTFLFLFMFILLVMSM